VQHASGLREAAWDTLAASSEVAQRSENPQRNRSLEVLSAEFHLREGNLDAAERALENVVRSKGSETFPESLVLAELSLKRGDARAACDRLDRAEGKARDAGLQARRIAILVLRSLSWRALGKRAAAIRDVRTAVSLAAPGGFRRVFLDGGGAVAWLLEGARDVAPAFVDSLLRELSPSAIERPEVKAPTELLGETQMQILSHLDRGLTNQEIASKLDLTVGTTKWHLNQIFGKFQVRNRVEAIAKARELGLI
jgi:LuxR family maltose regulon positive regulatory protein